MKKDQCQTCGNKYHTISGHEIFKEYFEMSKEDLVFIIISLKIELSESSGKNNIKFGTLCDQK